MLCFGMSTWARRRHSVRGEAGAVLGGESLSQVEAGRSLRNHLERKFLSGDITAVDLSIQAHFTTLAGGVGLEDLAVLPEHAAKHAAQHIELVLGEKYPKPLLKILLQWTPASKAALTIG